MSRTLPCHEQARTKRSLHLNWFPSSGRDDFMHINDQMIWCLKKHGSTSASNVSNVDSMVTYLPKLRTRHLQSKQLTAKVNMAVEIARERRNFLVSSAWGTLPLRLWLLSIPLYWKNYTLKGTHNFRQIKSFSTQESPSSSKINQTQIVSQHLRMFFILFFQQSNTRPFFFLTPSHPVGRCLCWAASKVSSFGSNLNRGWIRKW